MANDSDNELLFSPLDNRYRKGLPRSLSEQALLEAQIQVEIQYLECLMEEGLVGEAVSQADLQKILSDLSFSEIEAIEERTQHATRALVEAIIDRLKKSGHSKASEWIHVGITSFDTVDTAARIRLKKYFTADGFVAIENLKKELARLSKEYSNTPQVGRTHGQWAVPSLFGLVFGEIFERVQVAQKRLEYSWAELRGQASGAVGAYQALGILVDDPIAFESRLTARLDLKPSLGSTQILPPEDMVALAQDFFLLCSPVAKLAHDLRHLARSEIGEIAEGLSPGQVGSSTMPQKRNPWNLEHVCSLYKVLQSRLELMQSDILSEHQRDLTNSASGRFYSEFFCIAHLILSRMTRVLSRLEVFPEKMKSHLEAAGDTIFAEALYVYLTQQGVSDAHNVVRQASRKLTPETPSLVESLKSMGVLPKEFSFDEIKVEVFKGPRNKMSALVQSFGD